MRCERCKRKANSIWITREHEKLCFKCKEKIRKKLRKKAIKKKKGGKRNGYRINNR